MPVGSTKEIMKHVDFVKLKERERHICRDAKRERKTIPPEGAKRTRVEFLCLPLTIDGKMKWLRYAEWEEISVYECTKGPGFYGVQIWKPLRWLESDKRPTFY